MIFLDEINWLKLDNFNQVALLQFSPLKLNSHYSKMSNPITSLIFRGLQMMIIYIVKECICIDNSLGLIFVKLNANTSIRDVSITCQGVSDKSNDMLQHLWQWPLEIIYNNCSIDFYIFYKGLLTCHKIWAQWILIFTSDISIILSNFLTKFIFYYFAFFFYLCSMQKYIFDKCTTNHSVNPIISINFCTFFYFIIFGFFGTWSISIESLQWKNIYYFKIDEIFTTRDFYF